MTGKQHAEFVDATRVDLVHEDALLVLHDEIAASEFVHRQHRVIAGVIGVMHGRAVDHTVAITDGEVVGDRDRLTVRDEEAVEMPGARRPGTHPRRSARLRQEDGGSATEVVAVAISREMPLVGAPTEFGGLAALAHEAVHRPGVDELARTLAHRRDLRIALGDVDDLDAEGVREPCPILARVRVTRSDAGVGGDVEQRLFHEVGHQTRIGAMGEHRRRCIGSALAQRERVLAQGVVRAARGGKAGIGVAPRPRFDAGVEIERAALAAEADEIDGRHIDRHVDDEIALAHQRAEHRAEVVLLDRLLDEAHAEMLKDMRAALIRCDHGDAARVGADVAQDERQHALADAAEADEHDAARELHVDLVVRHDVRSLLWEG